MSASSTAAASVILASDPSSSGSPTARASTTSLTGPARAPIRDSISSTKPGGTTGSPSHRQKPPCCASRPSATSCSTILRRYKTLPRVSVHSRGGIQLQGATQRRRDQRRRFVPRQRLQVEPVELAGLPQFLCPSGNRFTVTHREHHFGGGPLHDVMHNERRQVIEQVHVIDTHHHRGARGRGSQRLDHAAHQLETVTAGAHEARAPSGSVRAEDVPIAQWVTHPRAAAADSASRAIRLFPTPAAPQITIPENPGRRLRPQ